MMAYTSFAGTTLAAAAITCANRRLPPSSCSTLGCLDFSRVPLPAAMMAIAMHGLCGGPYLVALGTRPNIPRREHRDRMPAKVLCVNNILWDWPGRKRKLTTEDTEKLQIGTTANAGCLWRGSGSGRGGRHPARARQAQAGRAQPDEWRVGGLQLHPDDHRARGTHQAVRRHPGPRQSGLPLPARIWPSFPERPVCD